MVTIIEPGRVTPLLTIHSSNFLHFYQRGLWWKQHGDEQQPGPMPDSYLVECLEIWVARGWFDQSPQPKVNERRQEALELSLGFAIGMVHSGIIALDGEIWPGVYTLVTIIDQEFARGYQIGREWYLHEATPEDIASATSDTGLLERIIDMVAGNRHHFTRTGRGVQADGLIYWSVGQYLGELSGRAFPLPRHTTEPFKALSLPELAY